MNTEIKTSEKKKAIKWTEKLWIIKTARRIQRQRFYEADAKAWAARERLEVEEEMKKLPFYEETVTACLKFRKGKFRTLDDQMTPLERLQEHYFKIQNNSVYCFLRKWKCVP